MRSRKRDHKSGEKNAHFCTYNQSVRSKPPTLQAMNINLATAPTWAAGNRFRVYIARNIEFPEKLSRTKVVALEISS